MRIDALVEGRNDEVTVRRIVAHSGHEFGACFGHRGIDFVRQKLKGYAERARYGMALLAVVDFMDSGLPCPGVVPAAWLPKGIQNAILRVAVPEMESWLLADRKGIAGFLGVREADVPDEPERLADPKQSLISLARRSRRSAVRSAFVPRQGTSGIVGPEYSLEIERFASRVWNIEAARTRSASLHRCLLRLERLA